MRSDAHDPGSHRRCHFARSFESGKMCGALDPGQCAAGQNRCHFGMPGYGAEGVALCGDDLGRPMKLSQPRTLINSGGLERQLGV